VLGVVAVESFWRSRGFHPVLTDDAGLWALARGHVQKDNPHQIVLVGSSRIHLGVDVGTLAGSFPDWPRPVQLAIHGSNCLPVLQQLSRDEHFVGIAIVEVKPWSFYAGISLGGPRDATEGDSLGYVQAYERQSAVAPIEQRLRIIVQSSLALRSPAASVSEAPHWLKTRKLPVAPRTGDIDPERGRHLNFQYYNLPAVLEDRKKAALEQPDMASPQQIGDDFAVLEEMVTRIQARGGRVVYLNLPTGGAVKAIEDQRYPRAQTWDRLVKGTKAITINFEEYPTLAAFHPPDDTHLDEADTRQFTAAMAAILKSKL